MVNCKTMGKSFDIGLERLTGTGVGEIGETREGGVKPPLHGAGRQDAGATLNASFEEKNRTLKGGPFDFAQDYRCGTHGSEGETFYLETFGCQMNDHDSEKVAGVLLARGYRQVETPEAAKVILYNTCSIREKAAQKVFSRLGEFGLQQNDGRIIGVLGCVAQQEGEEIFRRAPWVSLVCGSASYRRLPELVAQIEAGGRCVMGLS